MANPTAPPETVFDFFLIFAPADRELGEALFDALTQRTPGRVMPVVQTIPNGSDVSGSFLSVIAESQLTVVLVTRNAGPGLLGRRDVRHALDLSVSAPGHRYVVPLLVGVALEEFRALGVEGLDEPIEVAGVTDEEVAATAAQALLERLMAGQPEVARPSLSQVEELEKLLVGKMRNKGRDTMVAAMFPRMVKLAREVTAGAVVRAGDVVAGARLVRAIGVDSFCTTWYAKRETSGEPCIAKVFRLDRLMQGSLLWGFRRAIRALQQLSEPGQGTPPSIVKLLQVSDDTLAFSTAFEPGGSLEHVASRGWNMEQKRRIFREVCSAVEFAHQVGVVHGDIKPASILLDAELRPVLTNFALAASSVVPAASGSHAAATLFLAPEARSGDPSERSDIYSLGRVLHYLLLDRSPGPHSEAAPRPDNLSRFPPAIVEVVSRATDLDPGQRYASVSEMLADLGAWPWDPGRSQTAIAAVEARPKSSRPSPSPAEAEAAAIPVAPWAPPRVMPRPSPRLWAIAAAIIVLVGALGYWATTGRRPVESYVGKAPTRTMALGLGLGPDATGDGPPGCKPSPLHCDVREVTDPDGLVFVHVCPGTLCMGTRSDDPDARLGESPIHRVDVPEFFIGRYEVSNAEYRTFDSQHAGPDNFPATGVSWDDARRFCEINHHRLPTEAEWEYAARGTDGRKYPWGDLKPMSDQAIFGRGESSVADQHPESVKSRPAGQGPFGTFNQAGNVQEWVADCYVPDTYARQVDRADTSAAMLDRQGCDRRVVRGGSYRSAAWAVRAADRRESMSATRIDSLGFRCAR